MTQRNPMNERYQREDLGKTRKSAASAKPVSKAASSVRVQGSGQQKDTGLWGSARKRANKSSAGKANTRNRETAEQRARYYDPGTPEYKKWRRWWWGCLVGALVITTLSFAMQMWLPPEQITVSYVLLGLGYVLLIVAIWIDFAKVRKIRNNYRDSMTGASGDNSKAATRARKAAKAQAKLQEQAEAEEAAAREAAYQQRQANRKGVIASLTGRGKKAQQQDSTPEKAED